MQEFRSCRMGSAIFRTLRDGSLEGCFPAGTQALCAWLQSCCPSGTKSQGLKFLLKLCQQGLQSLASEEGSTKWLSTM